MINHIGMATSLKIQRMPVKETTRQVYEDIRVYWEKLQSETTPGGARKHHYDAILEKTATKFRKAPSTIENIVNRRV